MSEADEIIMADTDGYHGHLEGDVELLYGGAALAELIPVQRQYRFEPGD